LLALGVSAFGILVFIILRQRLATPLRQLVEAIDGVSQGDMSRTVLPERDDEIGSLAARFNAMMSYLREAQEREARANASRHVMETHLRRAEKLATVGQLAAEIAHEVGTPLNVIGGRARSLAKRASDRDVQKNAEIISAQVDRITKIIRQVLDSSRKSEPRLSEVDVLRVVHETLEFVDGMLRRNHIEARVSAADGLVPIAGDADEIQQVCLNMIMNALHAMPDGGALTVSLRLVTRRKEGLELSPPSPYLMLEISDSGPGIPFADREKIFEAFFTTKESGLGSGLGLAVSKGIVKDHEGWIEVDDAPEGGACFRVFLPAGRHPASQVKDDSAAITPAPLLLPGKPLPNDKG
jgi:signal transduction histidine kinase